MKKGYLLLIPFVVGAALACLPAPAGLSHHAWLYCDFYRLDRGVDSRAVTRRGDWLNRRGDYCGIGPLGVVLPGTADSGTLPCDFGGL